MNYLPTTRACYGLLPIRLRPYWAHTQKGHPPSFHLESVHLIQNFMKLNSLT